MCAVCAPSPSAQEVHVMDMFVCTSWLWSPGMVPVYAIWRMRVIGVLLRMSCHIFALLWGGGGPACGGLYAMMRPDMPRICVWVGGVVFCTLVFLSGGSWRLFAMFDERGSFVGHGDGGGSLVVYVAAGAFLGGLHLFHVKCMKGMTVAWWMMVPFFGMFFFCAPRVCSPGRRIRLLSMSGMGCAPNLVALWTCFV